MNLLTPPARRRWLIAALAVALLAALAIAFALGQRNPSPAADARLAAPADAPTGPAIAAEAAHMERPAAFDDSVIPVPGIAPTSAHRVPLPPADAPLAEIFDELLDRLQRGDARAGCRLYREMRRCWAYARAAPNQELLMAMATNESADDLHMTIAINVLAGTKEAEGACAGIELERLENHYFDTVRRTAELGDALAMVEFAEGRAFLGRDYARYPERLALWHRLAPELVERALRMGSPEAAWLIAEARSGPNGLLGELLPTDRVEAEAMRRLLQILHSRHLFAPDGTLTPAESEAAQGRAETLHEQYFRHRPQPPTLRGFRDDLTPGIEHCEPLD